MSKKPADQASSDQTTQPADAGFLTPAVSEVTPQEGGSYTRDPETGKLTKISTVEVENALNP
ncbi:hypothetical protein [Deefgea rivuli]|uniref:hypothetical protein n=1 Tax=Deefgea rivuli TaxID=400948 RepID=UPI000488DF06|nr:hypothetical protein [Deefgea rivuli]